MLDEKINSLIEATSLRSKEYTDLKTFEMISRLENSPLFNNNLNRLQALIESLRYIEAEPDSGEVDLSALAAKTVLNADLIHVLETKLDALLSDSEAQSEFNASKFDKVFELIAEQSLLIESLGSGGNNTNSDSTPKPDYIFYGTGTGLTANILYRWDIFLLNPGFRLERFDGDTNDSLVFDSSQQVPLTANRCRTLFNNSN